MKRFDVCIPRWLFVLAFWGAPFASPLGAQGALDVDPRLEARYSGEALRRLHDVVLDAHAAGLPTELVVQRALEGASRGVPADQVIAAVSSLVVRLRTARRALGPDAVAADLLAAASALHAGIDEEWLRRLAGSRRGSVPGVALPLIVLVDIVERGVPPDTAKRLVLAIADPRIRESDVQALRLAILRDIGAGAPAGVAAMARTRGLLAAHGLTAAWP